MISRASLTKFLAAAALFSLSASAAFAQDRTAVSDDQAKKINELFRDWDSTDAPGCTLSVMRDGKIIYKHAYGMANLDYDVTLTTDTPFHVASVSKQFVAASIVLLEQDGKLSFDDDVRKYIPELPDFGTKITIRQLLHHTSGLRDQWDLLGLAGWRYSLDLITNTDVMSVVTRQKELNFPPGSEYSYSNTGYTLLGEIVKHISGKSLREFTTERIFVPLGMANTHFRDNHAEIIKHQAYGYDKKDNSRWELDNTNFDTVGATSLFTTVEDLALWDENFYTGKVGGPRFTETMLHHDPLTDGKPQSYAFGLDTGKYRGLDTVDHGGADAGYRSDLLRFPQQHFSVACLCNNGGAAGPGNLARKVADILLASELKDEPQKDAAKSGEKPIHLTLEQLQPKVGFYKEKNSDDLFHLVIKENDLGVAFGGDYTAMLDALTPERFRARDFPVTLTFTAEANNLFLMQFGEGENAKSFDQLPSYTLSAAQPIEYVGNYRSEEIDPVYRVVEKEGKLQLQRLKHDPETLTAIGSDFFQAPLGTLRFQRDAKKNVTGMMLTTGRVRNLRFTKEAAKTK